MQVGVVAGRPAIAADLSRRGGGVPPPQNLTGLGIERGQAAAHSIFTAGDPAVHDAVVIKRCAGDPIAVLPGLDLRTPHFLAGLDVERYDVGIELAEEHHSLPHRQPTIVPATADAGELLVDTRPALPQELACLGVQREYIVVACDDVHDAVLNEGCRFERVFTAVPGALQAGHPGALELLDVARVNLFQG